MFHSKVVSVPFGPRQNSAMVNKPCLLAGEWTELMKFAVLHIQFIHYGKNNLLLHLFLSILGRFAPYFFFVTTRFLTITGILPFTLCN